MIRVCSQKKKVRGFAMLEVVIALTLMAIASFGIYSFYSRGVEQNSQLQITNELLAMATAFTSLSNADLLSGISSSTLASAFYNSQDVPKQFFNDDGDTMVSPYGELSFGAASSVAFTVTVPVEKGATQDPGICKAVSGTYDDDDCHFSEDDGITLTYSLAAA
jgi:prepilin-type N-terminal cleavage/methylation domain-containing protein